jgi:hypothetical protein
VVEIQRSITSHASVDILVETFDFKHVDSHVSFSLVVWQVRLVQHSPMERSFHVFYQILAGCSEEEREAWEMTRVEDYQCVMQRGTVIQAC